MSAADNSGNSGHLKKGAACIAAATPQTANALSVTATGTAPGTTSAGPKTISASAQTVAGGTLADTLTLSYSLLVGSAERLVVGCVYSTTLTYTVQ